MVWGLLPGITRGLGWQPEGVTGLGCRPLGLSRRQFCNFQLETFLDSKVSECPTVDRRSRCPACALTSNLLDMIFVSTCNAVVRLP